MSGHETAIQSPEEYDGYGVVAFLDVLGFSEAALRDWRNVLPRILSVKNAVGVSTPGITVAVEDSNETYRPVVKAVSDSIILAIPLEKAASPLGRLSAFISMAMNVRFAWKAAISHGFVLRGAIESGEIYWNSSDILGPALVKAYHLENNKAKSIRIMVGPELLSMLSELDGKIEYGPGWLSYLTKCQDDRIALSPMYFASADDVEQLEEMRTACADTPNRHEKYHEIISVLKKGDSIGTPTFLDLFARAKLLTPA